MIEQRKKQTKDLVIYRKQIMDSTRYVTEFKVPSIC